MAAKEKASSRWSAWLAPILFLLAAVAAAGPASALTCGALQTRAWEKTPAPLESRPVESLQLLNLHQQNGGAEYDDALGSPLAANNPAPKAGDVKSPADLPDYKQWPSKPAQSGKGTVYTDPTNPGRQVREMDPVTHQGADPAKQSPGGYTRYSDGYGGKTPPMPR